MLDLQNPALINLTFRKSNIKEIKSNNFNKSPILHNVGSTAPESAPLACLLLHSEMSSKEDVDGESFVFILVALTRDSHKAEVLYHSEMK